MIPNHVLVRNFHPHPNPDPLIENKTLSWIADTVEEVLVSLGFKVLNPLKEVALVIHPHREKQPQGLYVHHLNSIWLWETDDSIDKLETLCHELIHWKLADPDSKRYYQRSESNIQPYLEQTAELLGCLMANAVIDTLSPS